MRGLVVRNNTFSGINHTNIQVGAASRESNKDGPADEPSRDTVNVLIENNRFTSYGAFGSVFDRWPPGMAIRVQCARDVTIRRNDFGLPAPGAPQGVEKVRVENSDHVILEENSGMAAKEPLK